MCEKFSAYFNEKIAKAKTNISLLKIQLTPSIPPVPSQRGSMLDSLAVITVEEISKLIAQLPNKSSPLDYLHTSVFKSCSNVLSPLITRFANLPYNEG